MRPKNMFLSVSDQPIFLFFQHVKWLNEWPAEWNRIEKAIKHLVIAAKNASEATLSGIFPENRVRNWKKKIISHFLGIIYTASLCYPLPSKNL